MTVGARDGGIPLDGHTLHGEEAGYKQGCRCRWCREAARRARARRRAAHVDDRWLRRP